jgi:N-acyl-D-amino-acid deacylase
MTYVRYVHAVVAALVLFVPTVRAQDYDIAILNGRVMDSETKFDVVRNVGINDGKIVTITEDAITGKETIDAKDHVVVPGFIDTHIHSSDKFSVKISMMDGVTSGMDFEMGAVNIAAWYDREKGKWPMNYGQVVSHEMVRMMVHDGIKLDDPVDSEEFLVTLFCVPTKTLKRDYSLQFDICIFAETTINHRGSQWIS